MYKAEIVSVKQEENKIKSTHFTTFLDNFNMKHASQQNDLPSAHLLVFMKAEDSLHISKNYLLPGH